MFEGCSLCECEQELRIVGDPMEQVPARVWEVMRTASLLDMGINAMPEVGAWSDQPAAWCGLIEYVFAERSRMRRESDAADLERLTG